MNKSIPEELLPKEVFTQSVIGPDESLIKDSVHQSQADKLIMHALDHITLFHDENRHCFAQDKSTGETRRIDSRSFKDWLMSEFYLAEGKSVKTLALTEAIANLSAQALHQGPEQKVHLRIAESKGVYFLDLCEPGTSRAIQWNSSGWQIVDRPDVLFVRGDSMKPTSIPDPNGSIDPLWNICNIPASDRPLIVAWLIEALRPDTPCPGLEIIGEMGSGKSTTAKALRRIIDPNSCDLRSAPKTTEDVFICAGVNHVVAYENLSHLSPAIQDTLCILSTGGGFAKRKLYTDADESVINVQRPWMLNGISAIITAQDLLDRAICIECPVLSNRTTSGSQWSSFEAALPSILGGLLSLATEALKIQPDIQIKDSDKPRLIEYCLIGMALTYNTENSADVFLNTFRNNRKESINRTIDASPVCTAIIDLLNQRPEITASTKDLLQLLTEFKPERCDAWPRSAKGLGDALRRAAPALRQLDIECRSLGKSNGLVRWMLKTNNHNQSPKCPEVFTAQLAGKTLGHSGHGAYNYSV